MPDDLTINGASNGTGIETPSANPTPGIGSDTTGMGGTGGTGGAAPASAVVPGPEAGAGAGQQATAPAPMSVRDYFRGRGLDFTHLNDDHAVLSHLELAYRQAQEAQRWAPYAQQYAQHAEQFNAWMRQQQQAAQQPQQPAQQPQQPAQKWWNAPEFDPAWRQKMRRNEVTGQLEPVPGAPPDLVNKYLQAVEHQQQFMDKFAFDPIGAIKPGIEEVAMQVAQQVVAQQMGQYQNYVHANQTLDQHADWLYQKDQNGQFVYGPSYQQTGRPELSQLGRVYRDHVITLERSGLRDQAAVDQMARALTERDVLAHRFRQAQQSAATPQQQANQQFLAAHNRPNVAGSLPNGTQHHNPNGTPTQNGRMDLAAMLRRDLSQGGVTDAVIQAGLQ